MARCSGPVAAVTSAREAGVLVIAVVLLFWKEFKLLGFDPAFGTALGYPMNLVDYLLTALLVLTIVLGLQTVGVVLMSAMVVMPAVAARQWTDRLGRMVLVAAIIGSLAGVSGALWSSSTARMPTGPTIVVCLFALVVISLLFAPRHGLVFGRIAGRVQRKRLQVHAALLDLHELSVQHSGAGHAHALAVLRSMNPAPATVLPTLLDLQARGWVEKSGGDLWRLTPTELVLMLGGSGTARPMGRTRLEELIAAWPDKTEGNGNAGDGRVGRA